MLNQKLKNFKFGDVGNYWYFCTLKALAYIIPLKHCLPS